MDILERTKETAKQKGMTLRQLEAQAGLGQNSLYRWKKSHPSTKGLESVAKVLGVSVDYLLGNDEGHYLGTARFDDKDVRNEVVHSGAEDKDLAKMIDGAVAFNGKPLTDHDKRIILSLLETMKADGEL